VKVLGVDASLRSTGVGIVERNGARLQAGAYGLIKNPPQAPHSVCLRRVHEEITALLNRHHPDAAAIEGGFYFKNVRTAMILGEVRGVVIAACAAAGVPVYEYSPRSAKQAVTGFGGAQKDMVVAILGLQETPPEDAADALAIAICHAQSQSGVAALQQQPI